MTQPEARAQFATSHLYWHGPNHCWDATAPAHRIVRRVKPKEQQADGDSAASDDAAQDDSSAPAKREPTWRNALSEMLPADPPGVAAAVPSLPAIAATGMNWLDRWVDVSQVAPSSLFRRETGAAAEVSPVAGQKSNPMVTPIRLILVFFSIVVILAVIELLFRNTIHERLD